MFAGVFGGVLGELVGGVVVDGGGMDIDYSRVCDRFDEVIAIRKALAKRNRLLLEDAISEVDLAVWELLCGDPGVSDRDLYWGAVTLLRRCRRRRIRVIEREVLGSCWEHLPDGGFGVEDAVVTRVELESSLGLLRDDLREVVAGQAGWSVRRVATGTQRTALQRWRSAHRVSEVAA